jgi:hypothetical protein
MMSERTCPAETLAKIRNPKENDRNPIEIHSSNTAGMSSMTFDTSIHNWALPRIPLSVDKPSSIKRKITVERRIIRTISVTKIAEATLKDRLNAKLK